MNGRRVHTQAREQHVIRLRHGPGQCRHDDITHLHLVEVLAMKDALKRNRGVCPGLALGGHPFGPQPGQQLPSSEEVGLVQHPALVEESAPVAPARGRLPLCVREQPHDILGLLDLGRRGSEPRVDGLDLRGVQRQLAVPARRRGPGSFGLAAGEVAHVGEHAVYGLDVGRLGGQKAQLPHVLEDLQVGPRLFGVCASTLPVPAGSDLCRQVLCAPGDGNDPTWTRLRDRGKIEHALRGLGGDRKEDVLPPRTPPHARLHLVQLGSDLLDVGRRVDLGEHEAVRVLGAGSEVLAPELTAVGVEGVDPDQDLWALRPRRATPSGLLQPLADLPAAGLLVEDRILEVEDERVCPEPEALVEELVLAPWDEVHGAPKPRHWGSSSGEGSQGARRRRSSDEGRTTRARGAEPERPLREASDHGMRPRAGSRRLTGREQVEVKS
mmetsp:Transcript_94579/g.253822  ORF Transcript_94579/g.253822 Transcript_94579/m.253822 type:complete len:439 (+) Transcript_94579:433-1749(+)